MLLAENSPRLSSEDPLNRLGEPDEVARMWWCSSRMRRLIVIGRTIFEHGGMTDIRV